VGINSVKAGIINKPRTSSWGPFLLASRGGLTGAFDLALGGGGGKAFLMSPLEIEPAREGLEVLSFWPSSEGIDCIFVKVTSPRVDNCFRFSRLWFRCVAAAVVGDGGRGFMARAISRVTRGTSAEDTVASACARIKSFHNVKLQNETYSYDYV